MLDGARRKGLLAYALLVASVLLASCSQHNPLQVAPPDEPLAAQAEATQLIRVGVVPSATSIEIGSDGSYVLRNKVTGETLLSGFGDTLTVTLGSSSVVRTHWRLQVACVGEASRDSWLARAHAEGYPTYTEFVERIPCWRLLIGELPSGASESVRDAFKDEVIAKGLAGSDSLWRQITTAEGVTEFVITRAGDTVTTTEPVVLEAENGLVHIGGSSYRGLAEVATNSGGTLAGINELPREQYLYGVVPRELPPVPFGEVEAQKAQAVAARTYVLANLGERRADGYDLLPTTSDQVYGGYAAEHPVSTQAVDETVGIAARYGGGYATTLYHSTSGGFTANNEDVYNSAPIAYLRRPARRRARPGRRARAQPRGLQAQRQPGFAAC